MVTDSNKAVRWVISRALLLFTLSANYKHGLAKGIFFTSMCPTCPLYRKLLFLKAKDIQAEADNRLDQDLMASKRRSRRRELSVMCEALG